MKKTVIMYLSLFYVIPSSCDIWTSLITKSVKAGEKVANVIEDAENFFKNQVPGCAKVVGLGTAYGTAQAALETASFAVNSAQVVGKKVALDTAEGVLEGAKQSSIGILNLANTIVNGVAQGFNIKCIRFLGSLEKLEFELDANLLGKSFTIRESVDFDDLESFAKKIFEKVQDELKNIF